jgi:hypothetical protein
MPRERLRTVFDLERDQTLPQGVYGIGDDIRFKPRGRRLRAVEDVLCSLPDDQYEAFRDSIREGTWFIPHFGLWGLVGAFPSKKIIYLSPFLEFVQSQATINGLVVHEVAHYFLGHIGAELSTEQKEEQVNRVVREWGFVEETEAIDKELWTFFVIV